MARHLKPKSNEVLTLEVVDLSHEGQGIAKHNGRAVFIDGVLPGETVTVQLLRHRKGIQEAVLNEVITASPNRVEPKCQHYKLCGGCVEQHLHPAQQLQFKQTQLLENMTRIGKVEVPEILPPLQARVWNYRRRARLGARFVIQKNRTLVGFRERSGSKLADIQRCVVLHEPLDELIEPMSLMLGQLSVRDRVPQVECAVADNVTALVIRILDDINEHDMELLKGFQAQHQVQIYLQREGYDSIKPLVSAATQSLLYRLPQFNLEYEFLPNDFIQVNGELNQLMIGKALELLQVNQDDRVADLFCGIGNFTLPLAQRAHSVLGVEGEVNLVARAKSNAVRNHVHNAEFVVGNLFEDQQGAPWTRGTFNKVLLDPPRAGAREILPMLPRLGAQRIVYISCHPGTLARDADILVNQLGYRLLCAGVLDMFPHTAHVESMAVFEKR